MHTAKRRNLPIVEVGFITKYRRKRPLKFSCCLTCTSANSNLELAGHFDENSMNFTPINKTLNSGPFYFLKLIITTWSALAFAMLKRRYLNLLLSSEVLHQNMSPIYTQLAKIKFVLQCKHPWDYFFGSQIDCHIPVTQ